MLGQRWEYRIGNSIVMVDNAFNFAGWAQERLLVNYETVREARGWFGFYRKFTDSWLTSLGEGELRAILKSRLKGIECVVTVDGERQEPVELWEASWRGLRGGWPAEEDWIPARHNKWMA